MRTQQGRPTVTDSTVSTRALTARCLSRGTRWFVYEKANWWTPETDE